MLATILTLATLAFSFACALAAPTEPTQPIAPAVLTLEQNLDLVKGQEARLEDSGIVVKLIEAHGPRAGCHDCPIGATLNVRSNTGTIDLRYSFSGGMQPDLLEKAKRKTAFNFVFIAIRVSDAGLTVRVERPKPAD